MELGGLFGEMGMTAKQASQRALYQAPRSVSPLAVDNPRDIIFTPAEPKLVPRIERLKDESWNGSQGELSKKPKKSDFLTVDYAYGQRSRSQTAPATQLPLRQKIFQSINNLSDQVASHVNSVMSLNVDPPPPKETMELPLQLDASSRSSTSQRPSVMSSKKNSSRRESIVDHRTDKGYGAHRRSSTDPGKLDVMSVGRRLSSNRRPSIVPQKQELATKIAKMTEEACIQSGLASYRVVDIEDSFSASVSFANLIGSGSNMSQSKPSDKGISSPKRSTNALAESKEDKPKATSPLIVDTSQNQFKAIVQASVIMNSPTNMKTIEMKAAFYDELIANSETETDEIKSLVKATRKAKMTPTPTSVQVRDNDEDDLVRSYRLKKEAASRESLHSNHTLASSQNNGSKEPKKPDPPTPQSAANSPVPHQPAESVTASRRPSMAGGTAFSKLKHLMNNLVLPTVSKHLEEKKEASQADPFDYTDNMSRLKVLNTRVQQVIHGIFRDIQHEHIEKQHEMSAMFTDNLATMKRLTREAMEAEYAELLDENNLTKEIERLEAELTQVKGHLKQVLDHADKLQKELVEVRAKKAGSKEEYELLLADIGRLRIQNKALRAKVKKLEHENEHAPIKKASSRPCSARSTTSKRNHSVLVSTFSSSEEDFNANEKGKQEEEEEEEDLGSTPSLNAQWHKQQAIQEMNTRFSDGSLSSLVKTGSQQEIESGKLVDIDARDSFVSSEQRNSRSNSTSKTRPIAGGLVGDDLDVKDIEEEEDDDDIKEYCHEYTPRKAWNQSTQSTSLNHVMGTHIVMGGPTKSKDASDHSACKEEIRKLKDVLNKERSMKKPQMVSEATPRTKRIAQLVQFLETCLWDVQEQEASESNHHVQDSEWIDARNNPNTRQKVSQILYEKQELLKSILKQVDWHSHDIPKRSTSPKGHRNEHQDPHKQHMIEYAVQHLRPFVDEDIRAEFDSKAFATLVKSIKPTSPQARRRPQSACLASKRIPNYSHLYATSQDSHPVPTTKAVRPSSASVSRPSPQDSSSPIPTYRPTSASTHRSSKSSIYVSVPTESSLARTQVLKNEQRKPRPCSAPVGSKRSSLNQTNPSLKRETAKLNVVNVNIQ